MSMTQTGRGKCDKCGQLEDNTSILLFLIINDINPDTGTVSNVHLCRRNGCAETAMTAVGIETTGLLEDEDGS